ncbi:hypothetical protein PVK06_027582 [Gossypium arboreum]|uniref:Uncharacterized protein n=1 Tax=Gossypium arboreum TaxID=29729 RepID=A0ABR0P139_GOSAR|nr:hypothetical protein PVK06_027582 [Gossypium arboreum]
MNTVVGKKTNGGFGTMEDQNEIALLEEELIQLTVKILLVVPSENSTLICSVWTRKTPVSGSMSEHYIIAMGSGSLLDKKARQNLFTTSFEDEEDLKQILEGFSKTINYL